MSPEEITDFLCAHSKVILATLGQDGWPHLMPLTYVMLDGDCWAWTYGRSQKVRNMERDDRATLEVETGDEYEDYRGVMLRCRAVVHRDRETILRVGEAINGRFVGGDLSAERMDSVHKQAPKRVALQFVTESAVTWDHRKLAVSDLRGRSRAFD